MSPFPFDQILLFPGGDPCAFIKAPDFFSFYSTFWVQRWRSVSKGTLQLVKDNDKIEGHAGV